MLPNQDCIKAYNKIQNANNIIILPHKSPDIDSLATSLALWDVLKNKLQKKAKIITSSPLQELNKNLHRIDFLKGFNNISNVLPSKYDLVIYIDCANKSRVALEVCKSVFSISIDHHRLSNTNSNFADINLVDENADSSGSVLYEFLQVNNINISTNSAYAIYCAIVSDSRNFTSSKTNKNTFDIISNLIDNGVNIKKANDCLIKQDSLSKFKIMPKILNTLHLASSGTLAFVKLKPKWLKAMQAKSIDCVSVCDDILNISVVKIAFLLQRLNNTDDIKVSIRSYDDGSAFKIAHNFGGGGHNDRASFIAHNTTFKKTKKQIINFIKDSKEYK